MLFVIYALQPILNLLALSFTHPDSVQELNGLDIFPKKFSLLNYQFILSNPSIVKGIFNSVLYTGIGVFISVTFTVIAAFVLTREKLIGRKLFILITVFIMVFEPGIVPEYLVMKDFGLLGSMWSIILYKMVNVYYLIIMMRFFEDIPKSIVEAALLDGANQIKMLTRVFVPMSKPSIATITLFYSVYRWNEYFRSGIYLSSQPGKWPLQVVLRQFVVLEDTQAIVGGFNAMSQAYGSVNFEALQAAAIIVGIIPILLLYPIILRYFTKGTFEGSIK
jgi:putative aldouronate transport system permease protein